MKGNELFVGETMGKLNFLDGRGKGEWKEM
jgi:hypothetical protein